MPLCIADIKSKIPTFLEQLRSKPDEFPIDDAFELMSRVRRLITFFDQACPGWVWCF